MKVGDLIQMKYEMWWRLRDRKNYTAENGIVIEVNEDILVALFAEGKIRICIKDQWKLT
jgi:hypothetical protein